MRIWMVDGRPSCHMEHGGCDLILFPCDANGHGCGGKRGLLCYEARVIRYRTRS